LNGAESLVRTLVACGVETCFANPGTSEMHFVAAVDKVDGMRMILGLFEGAVTGMADGFGRMAESPAATLLHLGPGLANGLANLHNARRAATPIVNIVGNHATYHEQYDPPLASDVEGFARPVSGWIESSPSSRDVASDAARAVHAALQPPGQIATLILPADTAWLDAERPAAPLPRPAPVPVADLAVGQAAEALKSGKNTLILIRGSALKDEGLHAAAQVAAKTGARVACDTFPPRWQRGAGRALIEQIPYFAEQILDFMKGVKQLILVGAKPPVSFFAYPGKPSWCTPADCRILHLAHPHEDGVSALQSLAEAVGATRERTALALLELPDLPTGRLDAITAAQVIGRLLPEQAIVSDEASTSGVGLSEATAYSAPHDRLALTGGSIGQGIPVATGASVACPDRKVVCLQGDGGAMYTLQALWTQVRENLDVTTVVFANHTYAILNIELMRVGVEHAGPKALSMLDLHNPTLDWLSLAAGIGMEASRARTVEEFSDQFGRAMREHGPRLIEVAL
jgi:acetolactate synthase I/II/III large subunit